MEEETTIHFQESVLERSVDIPVLVDFWAPWCGPCRVLGPVLEKLAEEQSTSWELIKINVDDNPDVSSAYKVMSIPAVKLFDQGKVIAEFTGALSENSIRNWLKEYLPNETKSQFEEVLTKEKAIPDEEFIEAMRIFLAGNPEYAEAKVALARHLVFSNPQEATSFVEDIRMGEEFYDLAERIMQLAHFLTIHVNEDIEVAHVLTSARDHLAAGKLEEGIQDIIEANKLDKDYESDLPRITAIALFETLGSKHELTKKYRRLFDMVLY